MQIPKCWRQMIYTDAIEVNPRVHLARGKSYSFLDMASVDPSARCALASESRLFNGGGSRFVPGDTLLARITPCLENGKIARYCGPGEEAHGSTEFIVIRGHDNVTDSGYAYYLTKWEGVRGYAISQMTGTSGRQRVPTESLSNLIVPVPPLPEQRRIAHILGTLDDKIENNRKTAKTLEAMAQAIFKSWFVDFDPVRAKMAGESRESICKRLKLTPEILDLFPDRLVDSELGEIPEGWEVGTIIDIATISSGKRPENRLERPSEDAHIPLWGGNGPIGFVTEPLIYESCILTGRVGTLGTFFRINTPCWPSDNTLIIRAIKNAYYEYVFFNISQIDMTLLNRGSTQPLLTQSDLSSQPIVIPSSDIIGSFHDVSYTLLQYANFFSLNYSYVVIARDTLLPKLISGEIRVPEAEHLIEKAAV